MPEEEVPDFECSYIAPHAKEKIVRSLELYAERIEEANRTVHTIKPWPLVSTVDQTAQAALLYAKELRELANSIKSLKDCQVSKGDALEKIKTDIQEEAQDKEKYESQAHELVEEKHPEEARQVEEIAEQEGKHKEILEKIESKLTE